MIYNDKFYGGQIGWICPKCGRCYSPYTMMCPYCKGDSISINGLSLSDTDNDSISEDPALASPSDIRGYADK